MSKSLINIELWWSCQNWTNS